MRERKRKLEYGSKPNIALAAYFTVGERRSRADGISVLGRNFWAHPVLLKKKNVKMSQVKELVRNRKKEQCKCEYQLEYVGEKRYNIKRKKKLKVK